MMLFYRGIALHLLVTWPIVSYGASSTRRRISDIYYMYGDDEDDSDLDDFYVDDDYVYGDDDLGGPVGVGTPRSPVDRFVPLSCNENLNECVGWNQYFGSISLHTARLTLQCGDCVIMDFTGSTLTLDDGIDINGKLVFPEGYSLTLYTAGIVVQGELEMQSTQAPITGTPNVHIIMTGDDEDRSFIPTGENSVACNRLNLANNSCLVGKKSITVAGGSMNVHGIPENTPTWTRLYDVAGGSFEYPTQLILEDANGAIAGTWGVGAKILVTSHTLLYSDQQLRTIVSVQASGGNVVIMLDMPIRRPTTILESSDFAVEVAILSRNILLEGGTNLDDGGHMWVFYTPTVIQTIEGLEIRQFGQQGLLGKYPIHFHFCEDASGSAIRKNSIWQSHQRCVVLHGSDNLLVEDNVAYDTAGHCFLTENGIETGNYFLRNIGAHTHAPETVIPGSQKETDDEPATFWISNPYNFVEDNVGAGSEDSAFWYELRKRGSMSVLFPDPMFLPLGSFDNNVAHSNVAKTGAIRLYPDGYLPTVSNYAVASGLKAYRNQGSGMFVHKVHNFQISGALVADNAAIGIDVDRAEAIDIQDTEIIGKSNEYMDLMARDATVGEICNRNRVIGIDMHTWRLRNEESGAIQVRNVDIKGYSAIQCRDRWAISMDPHNLKQGTFELFATFEGINSVDANSEINFCRAVQSSDEPIESVYLVDLDGSLRPNGASSATPASLVSLSAQMTSFLDLEDCNSIQSRCFAYCPGICYRSIRFDVDPTRSERYILKVCNQSSPRTCVEFTGARRFNGNNPYLNYPRSFFAHLPPGNYVATFVDEQGSETWPSFVEQSFEEDLCNSSPSLVVRPPEVFPNQCEDMIYNGDFGLSTEEPEGWLNERGGLVVIPGEGSDGTNVISSKKIGAGFILQYLDDRCFRIGSEFRITVKFKLISDSLATVPCDPGYQQCPKVGIGFGSTGSMDVATADGTADGDGFETMSGDLIVNSALASSSSVYLFVEWTERNSSPVKRRIAIDSVSIRAVSQPSFEEPGEEPQPSPTPPQDEPTSDILSVFVEILTAIFCGAV